MNELSDNLISFAEFEVDLTRRTLSRDRDVIAMPAKAFDLLAYLIENNGRVISKDEILSAVWEGRIVEEANLAVQISNLRKALGENKAAPRFLVTVPGKGYRFTAATDENLFVVEKHSMSELTVEHEEEIVLRQRHFRPSSFVTKLFFAVIGVIAIGATGFYFSAKSESVAPKLKKLTKLTTTGKVFAAALTPDGNFAVLAQKEDGGESLWLLQLETGSQTRIVEPRPQEYVGLTVSPDNSYVYASVFSNNEIDPAVVRIPLIGGVPQPIADLATGASVSISPDNKRLAFTTSNSAENETLLGVSDLDGSNSRFLIRAKNDTRYLAMFKSSPVAWTPDGSEIAVAVNEKVGTNPGSTILLVDPDTGKERYLTERRWKEVDYLVWLDSDRLAFIGTDEIGQPSQIWLFSRQTGEAKSLTNDLQKYNWLAATNGKLVSVQFSASTSTRIANLSLEDSSIQIREIYTASEYLDDIDWDNEGRIVYVSRASGAGELWRMKADGSNRTQLTGNANTTLGFAASNADGGFVFSSTRKSGRGIWRADADGQNLRQLSQGADHSPDVSNDGTVVFHRGIGYSEGVFLMSRNDNEARLLRAKCYFPAISPDGSQVACYFMDLEDNRKWRIALVSTDTGQLIRKLDPPVPIYERQIRFNSSGNFITQIFSAGENLRLLLLPLDGSAPKIIDGLGKGISNMPEWSPDGVHFIYPLITESQDAVLLTDF